jgi:hypothetical protein
MEVKGTAIVVIPAYVKQAFKETGYAQWLQALSPEAREVHSNPVIVSNWYDYQKYLVAPTVKICDLFFHGDLRGAYALGRFSADFALHGIFKLFVKWGSPDFILKRAGIILPAYYRPSKIVVPVIEKGHALIQITEFPDLHAVVEQRIAGWISRAMEISGVKKLNVAITASLLKREPCTEFTLTWQV